ncbi:hypothetical protein B9Z55_002863 [Caenorhabditis nigoni]|nr:hypothetical protein B9Z55_002863 [Caenorhabditis nigoni]
MQIGNPFRCLFIAMNRQTTDKRVKSMPDQKCERLKFNRKDSQVSWDFVEVSRIPNDLKKRTERGSFAPLEKTRIKNQEFITVPNDLHTTCFFRIFQPKGKINEKQEFAVSQQLQIRTSPPDSFSDRIQHLHNQKSSRNS